MRQAHILLTGCTYGTCTNLLVVFKTTFSLVMFEHIICFVSNHVFCLLGRDDGSAATGGVGAGVCIEDKETYNEADYGIIQRIYNNLSCYRTTIYMRLSDIM